MELWHLKSAEDPSCSTTPTSTNFNPRLFIPCQRPRFPWSLYLVSPAWSTAAVSCTPGLTALVHTDLPALKCLTIFSPGIVRHKVSYYIERMLLYVFSFHLNHKNWTSSPILKRWRCEQWALLFNEALSPTCFRGERRPWQINKTLVCSAFSLLFI